MHQYMLHSCLTPLPIREILPSISAHNCFFKSSSVSADFSCTTENCFNSYINSESVHPFARGYSFLNDKIVVQFGDMDVVSGNKITELLEKDFFAFVSAILQEVASTHEAGYSFGGKFDMSNIVWTQQRGKDGQSLSNSVFIQPSDSTRLFSMNDLNDENLMKSNILSNQIKKTPSLDAMVHRRKRVIEKTELITKFSDTFINSIFINPNRGSLMKKVATSQGWTNLLPVVGQVFQVLPWFAKGATLGLKAASAAAEYFSQKMDSNRLIRNLGPKLVPVRERYADRFDEMRKGNFKYGLHPIDTILAEVDPILSSFAFEHMMRSTRSEAIIKNAPSEEYLKNLSLINRGINSRIHDLRRVGELLCTQVCGGKVFTVSSYPDIMEESMLLEEAEALGQLEKMAVDPSTGRFLKYQELYRCSIGYVDKPTHKTKVSSSENKNPFRLRSTCSDDHLAIIDAALHAHSTHAVVQKKRAIRFNEFLKNHSVISLVGSNTLASVLDIGTESDILPEPPSILETSYARMLFHVINGRAAHAESLIAILGQLKSSIPTEPYNLKQTAYNLKSAEVATALSLFKGTGHSNPRSDKNVPNSKGVYGFVTYRATPAALPLYTKYALDYDIESLEVYDEFDVLKRPGCSSVLNKAAAEAQAMAKQSSQPKNPQVKQISQISKGPVKKAPIQNPSVIKEFEMVPISKKLGDNDLSSDKSFNDDDDDSEEISTNDTDHQNPNERIHSQSVFNAHKLTNIASPEMKKRKSTTSQQRLIIPSPDFVRTSTFINVNEFDNELNQEELTFSNKF